MDPNTQPPNQSPTPPPQAEVLSQAVAPEITTQPTPVEPAPPSPSEPLNKEANKKSVFLIIGIIILIIIFVILSIILLMRNNASTPKAATQRANNVQTSEPRVTPINTPEATTSSDLEEATQVNTGDPTTDLDSIQKDTSQL